MSSRRSVHAKLFHAIVIMGAAIGASACDEDGGRTIDAAKVVDAAKVADAAPIDAPTDGAPSDVPVDTILII